MDSKKLFFALLSLSLLSEEYRAVEGGSVGNLQPRKLFVFGDSYVDTGNHRKTGVSSWKYPYGITFPGKPTGRFSDGRVLTDYLAKFLGVKSPIPYKWRRLGYNHLINGMNFAYGGAGVFDNPSLSPNVTTQIGLFQQLINESTFTMQDLQSSVALISLAGNDYALYQATNGSAEGWKPFIEKVVKQLEEDLRRIHGFGIPKLVVTALEPLGCLPSSTAGSSFRQCNATENSLVSFHNQLLHQSVQKLNGESKDGSATFVVLDLYFSFMSALQNKGAHLGNVKFENPLKPCCVGISSNYSCGSMDANGEKKYSICEDPQSAFFWDNVHPSQQGWQTVYSALQSNLKQL